MEAKLGMANSALERSRGEIATLDRRVNEARAAEREARAQAASLSMASDELTSQVKTARQEAEAERASQAELKAQLENMKAMVAQREQAHSSHVERLEEMLAANAAQLQLSSGAASSVATAVLLGEPVAGRLLAVLRAVLRAVLLDVLRAQDALIATACCHHLIADCHRRAGELIAEDALRKANEQEHVVRKRMSANRASMAAADAALRSRRRSDQTLAYERERLELEREAAERAEAAAEALRGEGEAKEQMVRLQALLEERGDEIGALRGRMLAVEEEAATQRDRVEVT